MAQEDELGGMAPQDDRGDGEGADEWVAPDESHAADEHVSELDVPAAEAGWEGAPEEGLPPLVTAADLLPPEDDPLASVPREPADDDTPPDEAVPTFIVVKNAYGPGAHSVKLPTGEPVGQWLQREYPNSDGGQVAEQLVLMGMDGELAAWFGLQRDRAREARGELEANPGLLAMVAHEAERVTTKKAIQDAFVKAYKKKEG